MARCHINFLAALTAVCGRASTAAHRQALAKAQAYCTAFCKLVLTRLLLRMQRVSKGGSDKEPLAGHKVLGCHKTTTAAWKRADGDAGAECLVTFGHIQDLHKRVRTLREVTC